MTGHALELMEIASPLGNLEAYVRWANQLALLSAEEEQALAQQFKANGDLQAARRLVLAHLKFVIKVARGYDGYGLQQADLIQEGNVGLMKAVKGFDPTMGVRLVSFAIHWIKAEIHEFIIRNWRIVRIATKKAHRKIFFNRRLMKKRGGWLNHEEVNWLAETLNVNPKDVKEMEERLNNVDVSFDNPSQDQEFSETKLLPAPESYLSDGRYNPELLCQNSQNSQELEIRLAEGLKQLDERSRAIVYHRWLAKKKLTLKILAEQYQVSLERIRQLEQQAFAKLKHFLVNYN